MLGKQIEAIDFDTSVNLGSFALPTNGKWRRILRDKSQIDRLEKTDVSLVSKF